MDNDFITWLNSELKRLGWNNNDLAQRANVTPSSVSMVLSGQRKPGVDFCKGVARALKMPQAEVFRKAGLITDSPKLNDDPTFAELLSYMRRLSADDRQDVLNYALFRYRQALEPSREANVGTKQANADAIA